MNLVRFGAVNCGQFHQGDVLVSNHCFDNALGRAGRIAYHLNSEPEIDPSHSLRHRGEQKVNFNADLYWEPSGQPGKFQELPDRDKNTFLILRQDTETGELSHPCFDLVSNSSVETPEQGPKRLLLQA